MTITVKYWLGTTQLEALATSYKGAMKIADRNENADPPRFFDDQGVEVFDDGNGLVYEGAAAIRTYAV